MQSAGTSPGGAPDDRIDIRSCVSWAIAIARPRNEVLDVVGGLCIPGTYVPVGSPLRETIAHPLQCPTPLAEAPFSITPVELSMEGTISTHSRSPRSLNHSFSLQCSLHSLTEPFHTAHQSTGQRQSCPSSRWTHIIWDSNDESVNVLHLGQ